MVLYELSWTKLRQKIVEAELELNRYEISENNFVKSMSRFEKMNCEFPSKNGFTTKITKKVLETQLMNCQKKTRKARARVSLRYRELHDFWFKITESGFFTPVMEVIE